VREQATGGGPARPGRDRGRHARPPETAWRREEGGKGEQVGKGNEAGERRRSGAAAAWAPGRLRCLNREFFFYYEQREWRREADTIATGDKSFSQELFITADYPWAAMSGKNFFIEFRVILIN